MWRKKPRASCTMPAADCPRVRKASDTGDQHEPLLHSDHGNALWDILVRGAVPGAPRRLRGAAAANCRRASDSDRKKIDSSAQLLGYMLGDALYDAYLKGRVSRSMLRRLFLVPPGRAGQAKEMYREIAAKVRCNAKKLPLGTLVAFLNPEAQVSARRRLWRLCPLRKAEC